MFEILFDKQPDKFLRKCDKLLFGRIIKRLKVLRSNPVPSDSKTVKGYSGVVFRIRIGDYRTLYRINNSENKIIVVKIDKRGRVYDN